MKKHRLYFGCALSGLPREHRERMIALRESLRDHFEILEFCDPLEVSDRDIYRHDIHTCIATADLMVAIVDQRGTGLGYEMGTMIEKRGGPVIALAHHDSEVSPFIRGIDSPKYELRRYSSLDEVRDMVLDFERRMFQDQAA